MTTPEFPYFIIEHQDNFEFPANGWSCIEYMNILRVATPQRVIITNITEESQKSLNPEFAQCAAITHHSLLDFVYNKNDINADASLPDCLRKIYDYHQHTPLVPAKSTDGEETQPQQDAQQTTTTTQQTESRICFLDEFGTGPLIPTDLGKFQYIIVGGILGDHPSVDKCAYLRDHNFQVRHLGERQLSTDTAVLACCAVLRHGAEIADMTYIDDPEVYDDEIDQIPKNHNKNCRAESTAVRMRYFTHQQPTIDNVEARRVPTDVVCCDPKDTTKIMTEYACICDCADCTQYKTTAGENVRCNINHAGDWYHSRPAQQQDLYKHTECPIARITPGLLEHIFESMNGGLFDLEGALDIDFEAMALGIDDAEDKELCKILFGDQ